MSYRDKYVDIYLARCVVEQAGAFEPVTQVSSTRTVGSISGHGGLGCGSGKSSDSSSEVRPSNNLPEGQQCQNRVVEFRVL